MCQAKQQRIPGMNALVKTKRSGVRTPDRLNVVELGGFEPPT